jgi:predicted AAA+ superfamily ATPase
MWEKFVRRVYDSVTKNIFITGSNSKFLSTDIATSLRGRSINYELFPLSFKEFLPHVKAPLSFYKPENKAAIIYAQKKFMLNGGFPEVVLFDDEIRIKSLQEYYNVMLYKDLIERYRITNLPIVKFFIKRVFESVTSPLSINKIYNELKSQGYKVGKNSLYNLIEEIESIYLTLSVKKYNNSILKQELSEKKYYCIDNGLLNSVTYSLTENYGKLFENMVCLEMKKTQKDVFFFKDKHECDFILMEKGKKSIVQVCYSLGNPITQEREIKSIEQIANYFKLKEASIISFDEEGEFIQGGITIRIIPFYKYFLQ